MKIRPLAGRSSSGVLRTCSAVPTPGRERENDEERLEAEAVSAEPLMRVAPCVTSACSVDGRSLRAGQSRIAAQVPSVSSWSTVITSPASCWSRSGESEKTRSAWPCVGRIERMEAEDQDVRDHRAHREQRRRDAEPSAAREMPVAGRVDQEAPDEEAGDDEARVLEVVHRLVAWPRSRRRPAVPAPVCERPRSPAPPAAGRAM